MKKALLVGINKYDDAPLRGCLNDLRLIQEYLIRYYDVDQESIVVMREASATKCVLIDTLQRMIMSLQSGDTLFFHYSGHGSYIPDIDFDEADKKDEVLCLADMDWNDPLVDDQLHEIYRNVPKGATLVVTMDCCHSGTNYRALDRVNRFLPPPASVLQHERRVRAPKVKIQFGDGLGSGNIICFSGCAADQYCADAYIDHDYYGAFTYYLSETIKAHHGEITYGGLLEQVRLRLRKNQYDQVPELYATDTDLLQRRFMA